MNDVVFAFWDSSPAAPAKQSELLALWRQSWIARGWRCRLLTVKDATRSARYKAARKIGPVPETMLPDFALDAVGGNTFLCPLHVINFSFAPPGKDFFARVEFYKYPGWERAAVVDFDRGVNPEIIRTCGRKI